MLTSHPLIITRIPPPRPLEPPITHYPPVTDASRAVAELLQLVAGRKCNQPGPMLKSLMMYVDVRIKFTLFWNTESSVFSLLARTNHIHKLFKMCVYCIGIVVRARWCRRCGRCSRNRASASSTGCARRWARRSPRGPWARRVSRSASRPVASSWSRSRRRSRRLASVFPLSSAAQRSARSSLRRSTGSF